LTDQINTATVKCTRKQSNKIKYQNIGHTKRNAMQLKNYVINNIKTK